MENEKTVEETQQQQTIMDRVADAASTCGEIDGMYLPDSKIMLRVRVPNKVKSKCTFDVWVVSEGKDSYTLTLGSQYVIQTKDPQVVIQAFEEIRQGRYPEKNIEAQKLSKIYPEYSKYPY